MRELKFRAWDDLNKKWLLGYDYPNLGGFSMMGEVMAFGEYKMMLDSFSLEDWDKIKIMQFTGLKDKNGKEIYEGDILSIHEHGTNYPTNWAVIYSEERFGFAVRFISFGKLTDTVYSMPSKNKSDFEIIGNVHENPELPK